MKYQAILFFILFSTFLFSQSENGIRVFTGKCAISQTGSGSGYWQIAVTNFNDPGGQNDATDIAVGDYVQFSDGGSFYALDITEVVESVGNSGTFKVSNVGIVGISSVPTTSNAAVSRRTNNYGLTPRIANISNNDDQLQLEWTMYKIDAALAAGFKFFSTSDTVTFSPSGITPKNGDFAWWNNRGQLLERKNGSWTAVANRKSSKNGENVNQTNRVTVAYGALGVTNYDLRNGNYFYTSANGDITINGSNECLMQTNDQFVFEVFNNTNDYITANFEPFLFTTFGVDSLGYSIDMPQQIISAFGTRVFTFTVVKLSEVCYLVSDDAVLPRISSGYFAPTITKNTSSDTIVATYGHRYMKLGTKVFVWGSVLVNNTAGTLSSSFRVSFPPGSTSNFTSINNDADGVATAKKEGFPATVYGAGVYADITNDRVTISYDTDTNAGARQLVEYSYSYTEK